ncbi:hypothetical protein NQ314_009830 [Rhamnusium bicolor]|uniref:G-protein coupled receptors family 1 profile domain-containing protein n=1 Tax=Rhamnusium bicolor TaxID=1586634 RepID=A0AAV8XW15_9CUCU|nr:hypothetical protein NQ314_009830 [Rhamnusium bicolor]
MGRFNAARHLVPGPCLVIFHSAKCHLDYSILETAERFNITLYCLPSNTTHELQPMNKSVCRAYEYYSNDEVVKCFSKYPDEHSVSKMRFGRIFSTVWDKTMTPSNIKAGFRATGIYPLNREAIPEVAFAPSSITNQDQGQEPEQQQRNNVMLSTSREEISSPAGPSTSGLQKKLRDANSGDSSSDSDSHISLQDESSDDLNSEEETAQDATSDHNISFTDMLITPDKAVTNAKRLRKPYINSRAQVITIDFFWCEDKNKATSKANINKRAATSKIATPKTKIMKESWFCKLCREDRPADMRLCSKCLDYVHEEFFGNVGQVVRNPMTHCQFRGSTLSVNGELQQQVAGLARNRQPSMGIDTDMVSEFDPSSSDSGVVAQCTTVKPLKLRLCKPIFGRSKNSKSRRTEDKKSQKYSSDKVAVEHVVPRVQKPRDPEREKRRIARKKEKRATLILGLIMGSFIACWLPFFFMYILRLVYHIPGIAFSTAFWLGYMNSALNPVIYTIFNKDFRRAFRRILFK